MDAPFVNCPGCAGTAGRAGCPTHHPAGVAEATLILHVHHWVYDGTVPGGFLYHCDEHDPPVVRIVTQAE